MLIFQPGFYQFYVTNQMNNTSLNWKTKKGTIKGYFNLFITCSLLYNKKNLDNKIIKSLVSHNSARIFYVHTE